MTTGYQHLQAPTSTAPDFPLSHSLHLTSPRIITAPLPYYCKQDSAYSLAQHRPQRQSTQQERRVTHVLMQMQDLPSETHAGTHSAAGTTAVLLLSSISWCGLRCIWRWKGPRLYLGSCGRRRMPYSMASLGWLGYWMRRDAWLGDHDTLVLLVYVGLMGDLDFRF